MTTFYTKCREIDLWNARNRASNPTADTISAVYANTNIHEIHDIAHVREAYGFPLVASSTYNYVHVVDSNSVMWCILSDFYDEVKYPTNEEAVMHIRFACDDGVGMFLKQISADTKRFREEELTRLYAESRDSFLTGWIAWEGKTNAMEKYEKLLAEYVAYISKTEEPWVNIPRLLQIGIDKLRDFIYRAYKRLKFVEQKQFEAWKTGDLNDDNDDSDTITTIFLDFRAQYIFEPLANVAGAIGDIDRYNANDDDNNMSFFEGIVDIIYEYHESA